jgi:hypothetical protein
MRALSRVSRGLPRWTPAAAFAAFSQSSHAELSCVAAGFKFTLHSYFGLHKPPGCHQVTSFFPQEHYCYHMRSQAKVILAYPAIRGVE